MSASFQQGCCKLSFMLVLLLGLCQVTQAQVFPVVHTPFPGDTSGAAIDIGLSVSFNAAGYSVPLPGGGTGLFHFQYCYQVSMTDDVKLPTTVVTDFDVANCLSTLFVAQPPTVLVDPLAGASHPELFTPPIWTPTSSTIHWGSPVAGPAYGAQWQFCFYSDIAPSLGTLTLGAIRINMDCSIDHPTLTIPYFGPCGPGNPGGGGCPKPICNAGGPYIATAGVPVTFDGTGSSGGGSGVVITSYAWNFGDGMTGVGAAPSHSYLFPGTYTVTLTVTNTCQKSCMCSTTVCVSQPPQEVCPKPICNAGGPYTGTAGVPVTFNGSGSSGPPPKFIVSYHWDFGDSTGFSGVTPTHIYTAAGTYVVVLTVTNSCQNSCSCYTTVTITNPPQAPPPCPPHLNNIAQVYPALVAPSPFPFKQLGCFVGDTSVPFPSLSVPGVLCLDTTSDNKLATNSFITCCSGGSVALQSVKLVKTVPGSDQFPGCYRPYIVTQLGRDNIRTWWTLNYTMPGTTFCLTLEGVCNGPGNPGGGPRCPRHSPGGTWRSICTCGSLNPPGTPCTTCGTPGSPGGPTPYSETWCWTVVANPETFLLLIDLFHTHEIGLSEVGCIVDENIYDGLVVGAKKMKESVKKYESQRTVANKVAALDAILSEEAFVLANCLSAEQLSIIAKQVSLPPGNFLPPGAGIFDTLENPCCCKLLIDLAQIQKQLDIPTL